jgi:hypothetical protein
VCERERKRACYVYISSYYTYTAIYTHTHSHTTRTHRDPRDMHFVAEIFNNSSTVKYFISFNKPEVRTYTRTPAFIYAYCIYACATYALTHTHTHTHTYIYLHIHTHIHIYIYTYTHIYIQDILGCYGFQVIDIGRIPLHLTGSGETYNGYAHTHTHTRMSSTY